MAFNVVVKGTTYSIPEAGQEPGWGEQLSAYFDAVAEALGDLISEDDVLQTSFTLQNNITSYTNVAGLVFNTASARGGKVHYTAYRTTDSNEIAEEGTISIVYKNGDALWLLSRDFTGDAGLDFDITNAGQIQYKTSNLSGSNYSGTLRFRAVMQQQ